MKTELDSADVFLNQRDLTARTATPYEMPVRFIEEKDSRPLRANDIALNSGTVQPVIVREVVHPITVSARDPDIETAPIQIFEGTVLALDEEKGEFSCKLVGKLLPVEDHGASIDLRWVVDQDRDLIRPGAIFYLTLFSERRRGSIKNSQEIRFRRLPAWNKNQLQAVAADAMRIKVGGKVAPEVHD